MTPDIICRNWDWAKDHKWVWLPASAFVADEHGVVRMKCDSDFRHAECIAKERENQELLDRGYGHRDYGLHGCFEDDNWDTDTWRIVTVRCPYCRVVYWNATLVRRGNRPPGSLLINLREIAPELPVVLERLEFDAWASPDLVRCFRQLTEWATAPRLVHPYPPPPPKKEIYVPTAEERAEWLALEDAMLDDVANGGDSEEFDEAEPQLAE